MVPLMNKRLKYYSNNKNKPIEFYDLVKNEIDQNEIVTLANKSPRDFIILLAEIFQEQSNRKSHVNTFDNESIRNGMINFCKNYDYDSITPSKQGRSKEIRSMINRLLILKLHRFTHKDLTSTLKQKDTQSYGQIKLMINYRLIREEEFPDDNGIKIYEIIDPKVKFMIKHLIERIE